MASAAAPVPQPAAPLVHPLRERNFRMLWAGSAISQFGDQFYLVALPWVVLELTGSAIAMGTIMMSAAIPRAVLMLIGGAVTDRFSPRKIYMSTATARTLFVAAIAALLWMKLLHIWQLYILAFGFGCADAFSMPAFSSYLPSMVKREQLVQANSAFQTTAQLNTIIGPAPAALVIKSLGNAWAFFLDAISFLFIIGALWRLPDPPKTAAHSSKPPLWRSIVDGIRAVKADVPLRSLMTIAAMLNFCTAGPMAVGLPYLAKTKFGSPTAYATIVSAAALGGLLGSLVAGLWKVKRRGLLMLAVCTLLSLCLGLIGILTHLWTIALTLLLMAGTAALFNVQIASWIQQRVDPTVRGRVMSVLMLSAFGLMPVSLACAGVLAAWSLRFTFILAGSAVLVVTGIGALHRQVRAIE